jgi:hypothetical protein
MAPFPFNRGTLYEAVSRAARSEPLDIKPLASAALTCISEMLKKLQNSKITVSAASSKLLSPDQRLVRRRHMRGDVICGR